MFYITLTSALALSICMVSGAPSPNIAANLPNRALERRFDDAMLTFFFEDGPGACGLINSDIDHVVALNSAQWDGGSHCFQTITLTANDKTLNATIADECPTCPFAGLDLPEGFFTLFAPASEGILSGTWNFN